LDGQNSMDSQKLIGLLQRICRKNDCIYNNYVNDIKIIANRFMINIEEISEKLSLDKQNRILQASVLELLCYEFLKCQRRFLTGYIVCERLMVRNAKLKLEYERHESIYRKEHHDFLSIMKTKTKTFGDLPLSAVLANYGYWSLINKMYDQPQ